MKTQGERYPHWEARGRRKQAEEHCCTPTPAWQGRQGAEAAIVGNRRTLLPAKTTSPQTGAHLRSANCAVTVSAGRQETPSLPNGLKPLECHLSVQREAERERGDRPTSEKEVTIVYWAAFVDLPTYSTGSRMCFQAVKGITIAHTALCPLQFHPCLFHGFLQAALSPTFDEMVIGCLPPSSLPPSVGITRASGNQGTKE